MGQLLTAERASLPIVEDDASPWNSKLKALYEYWLSIRPSLDRLPGRQHFDPVAIKSVLQNISLYDVQPAPFRLRYRLISSYLVDCLKLKDPTGKWLDESRPDRPMPSSVLDRYKGVVSLRAPSWRRGEPIVDRGLGFSRVQSLVLPLAGNGSDVDMLLVGSVLYDYSGREIR